MGKIPVSKTEVPRSWLGRPANFKVWYYSMIYPKGMKVYRRFANNRFIEMTVVKTGIDLFCGKRYYVLIGNGLEATVHDWEISAPLSPIKIIRR